MRVHNFYSTLITIFVLAQINGQTSKITYDGVDQITVDKLMQDRVKIDPSVSSYSIVAKNVFDSVSDPILVPPVADPIKTQAILDAKNKTLTPQQRLDALIQAIDLK